MSATSMFPRTPTSPAVLTPNSKTEGDHYHHFGHDQENLSHFYQQQQYPITPEFTGYSPSPSFANFTPSSSSSCSSTTTTTALHQGRFSPTSTTFESTELDYPPQYYHQISLSPFPHDLRAGQTTPHSEYSAGGYNDLQSFETHSVTTFECDHCGWLTEFNEHLALHAKAHAGEVPFECLIGDCDKNFDNAEDFLIHSNEHMWIGNQASTFPINEAKRGREEEDSAEWDGYTREPSRSEPQVYQVHDDANPAKRPRYLPSPAETPSHPVVERRQVPRSASMSIARTLSYGVPSHRPNLPRSYSYDAVSSYHLPASPSPIQTTFTIPSPEPQQPPQFVTDTFVLGRPTPAQASLLASPMTMFMGGNIQGIDESRNGVYGRYTYAKSNGGGGVPMKGKFPASAEAREGFAPLEPFRLPTHMEAPRMMHSHSTPLTGRPRPRSDSVKSGMSEPTNSELLVTADSINKLFKDYKSRSAVPVIRRASVDTLEANMTASPNLIPITPLRTASSSQLLTPPQSQKERFRPPPSPTLRTPEKIYVCSIEGCTKGFKRHEHLRRHERTHTDERPYGCDWPGCARFFSRSDNLTQHKKTHDKTLVRTPRQRKRNHAE